MFHTVSEEKHGEKKTIINRFFILDLCDLCSLNVKTHNKFVIARLFLINNLITYKIEK